MNEKMQIVFDHLKSQSVYPRLYDAWSRINDRWFDGELLPMPVSVILSDYGKARGFCLGMDHIAIQPNIYEKKNEWPLILHHEMCHQADHQDGLVYPRTTGRHANIHNSQIWCDRINDQMERMGDKRIAIPRRRNRAGESVCDTPTPSGRVVMTYKDLATWHPIYPD